MTPTNSFAAGSGAVTLTNAGNSLGGAVGSSGTGAVDIKNTGATVLGAIGSATGKAASLNLSSTGGAVTQVGAANVAGAVNIDAGTSSVTMKDPGSAIDGDATFIGSALDYFNLSNPRLNVTGITGDAIMTTGASRVTLLGSTFNGTSMTFKAASAWKDGVALDKTIPNLFKLGSRVNFVLTQPKTTQDLAAFFESTRGSTLIDGVPYEALLQFQSLASAANTATVTDQERRERERSAGLGRLKDGIRLNSIAFEELVAPLSYKRFEAKLAPCSKEQAEGKSDSADCK